MVKAENPRDSWDYRDGGRENQSCVLPERRGAVWSRLLIVEKHEKEKNVDDNMVVKLVNGHMFLADTLKNPCTHTHLSMEPVTVRVLMSHHSLPLAL